jgi:hypothetical protein
MIKISEAIKAINPTSEFSVKAEDYEQIIWFNDTTPINEVDIQAKQAELQAEYDALAYARKRQAEYPPTKDFMEAYTEKEIGGNSTKWEAYIINYNKVRTENPK